MTRSECTNKKCLWQGTSEEKAKKRINEDWFELVCPICGNNDFYRLAELVSPAVLRLSLKKKWFEMILSGEKKEEYREVKRFWICRLLSNLEYLTDLEEVNNIGPDFKRFDFVEFKNGYGNSAPTAIVECKGIRIGKARPEWSESFADDCFIISLGNVVSSTA